jgi:hypothetical protein
MLCLDGERTLLLDTEMYFLRITTAGIRIVTFGVTPSSPGPLLMRIGEPSSHR